MPTTSAITDNKKPTKEASKNATDATPLKILSAISTIALVLIAMRLIGVKQSPNEVRIDRNASTQIYSNVSRPEQFLTANSKVNTAERLLALRELSSIWKAHPQANLSAHHAYTEQTTQQQIQILSKHETQDWAVMTDHLFNIRLPARHQLMAYRLYVNKWGNTIRAEGLNNLTSTIKNLKGEEIAQAQSAYRFAPKPSSYGQSGSNEMAGAPPAPQAVPKNKVPKPIIAATRQTRPARPKKSPAPQYPKKAKRKKIDAVVVLSLDINEKGKVEDVSLVSLTATKYEKEFVRAAKRAAKKSRFYPALRDGAPIANPRYQRKYRFNSSE